MPTVEGIIFVPLAFYFFFKRPGLLFPLLVLSTLFQSSSIISSGSVGVQPYYCVAVLFIVRFIFMRRKPKANQARNFPFVKLWLAFAGISVFSAIVLPFVFSGIPVFDPRLTMEENILSPAALHFRGGNLIQSVFLLINILVVFAATRTGTTIETAHKMFRFAAYLLICLVFVQEIFFTLGLPFPDKLFNNNPGYGVVVMSVGNPRPAGSFTEPSMAGAVLAAIVAAFLWQYFASKTRIVMAGISSLACLLVASSSSLLAILVVFAWLFLVNSPLRLPWFVRIAKLKRMAIFLVGGLTLAMALVVPSIRAIVFSQTIEKGGSASALVRFAADSFAFDLAMQTHGLGVGLGSNRPSSFVASLVSQVGVVGLFLFVLAAWRTLTDIPLQDRWIGLATSALLLSMAFGLPDLSFPFLWILFALAAQSKAARLKETKDRDRLPSPANKMAQGYEFNLRPQHRNT